MRKKPVKLKFDFYHFVSSANGEENKCSCDLKDWNGIDNGILTGRDNLPVKQLLFGDSDGPYRKEFAFVRINLI